MRIALDVSGALGQPSGIRRYAEQLLRALCEAGPEHEYLVYAAFWREMVGNMLEGSTSGMGKDFTQGTRQTIFGLDRAAGLGIATKSPADAK